MKEFHDSPIIGCHVERNKLMEIEADVYLFTWAHRDGTRSIWRYALMDKFANDLSMSLFDFLVLQLCSAVSGEQATMMLPFLQGLLAP